MARQRSVVELSGQNGNVELSANIGDGIGQGSSDEYPERVELGDLWRSVAQFDSNPESVLEDVITTSSRYDAVA